MLQHVEPVSVRGGRPARPRRVALERWLRGRAEAGQLARADAVVVSFGNSGRTWLRVLLSRFYQTRHGLPRLGILDFDNLHRRNPVDPARPVHARQLPGDYTGQADRAALYRGKRLVLLARDPADVAVSQFHQWRHRMRRAKKRINGYPLDEDLDPARVRRRPALRRAEGGPLPERLGRRPAGSARRPPAPLRGPQGRAGAPPGRLLAFLGSPATPGRARGRGGVRLAGGDAAARGWRRAADPARAGRAGRAHGYKARRGKVGGYRDELPPETVAALDALIDRGLDPVFGYARAACRRCAVSGRPVVFVHTDAKQRLGAVVAAYALYRNAADPDGFEVRLLEAERVPALVAADGRAYLRDGAERRWRADDLQSFTPLRFMPPELMRYEGRALVIDPDVFAVGDVGGLLSADMAGHAILARWRPGAGGRPAYFASSVMLLDCARLQRWRLADQLGEMLDLRRDYVRWVRLELEPAGSVGPLAPGWNDFDHLDADTRLLHLTRRRTQPWKTGLRVDFQPPERPLGSAVLGWLNRQRRERLGEYALLGRYRPHPDPAQAAVFLGLLRECLEEGIVAEAELAREAALGHVRPDILAAALGTPLPRPTHDPRAVGARVRAGTA